MFNDNPRRQQQIATAIERVLVVDPHVQSARLMSELLRADYPCEVYHAPSVEHGFKLA